MTDRWSEISTAITAAAISGLDAGAHVVEIRAKMHAPVRHIFMGGMRRVRFKTMAEVEGDRDTRKRLGLGREYAAAPRTRLNSRRGANKAKTVTKADEANAHVPVMRLRLKHGGLSAEAESMLHRRGRSEVQSGRADFNGSVGGRLRGEIHALPATGTGTHFTAMVVSPTAYAKYQEFGTRHNPAHPFLRPALHESRAEVRDLIKAAVRASLRGKSFTEEMEI